MKRLFMVVLLVFVCTASADAEYKYKIHLKTGKVIKVNSYEKVGSQIMFPLLGGRVGISEEDIERIEEEGKGTPAVARKKPEVNKEPKKEEVKEAKKAEETKEAKEVKETDEAKKVREEKEEYERSGKKPTKYFYEKADKLYHDGKLREAHEAYLKAADYAESKAEKKKSYTGVARTSYKLGEYDMSKEYCEKILALSPNSWATVWLDLTEGAIREQKKLSDDHAAKYYSVDIGMYYMGRPLSEFTQVVPRFDLRKRKSKISYTKNISYDATTGKILVTGLDPGKYQLFGSVNANSENPPDSPGDFEESVVFDVPYEGKLGPLGISFVEGEVPFMIDKIIHMRLPEDNGDVMKKMKPGCGNRNLLKSPVRVVWEPLAEGLNYKYIVRRSRCKPYEYGRVVKSGTTEGKTAVSVDLPPTGENELYKLELRAYKGTMQVGHLMTRLPNGGFTNAYWFSIGDSGR